MFEIAGLFIPRKVQLISLGCSKNRVDSEKLLARLSGGSMEIIPEGADYEQSKPDAIIINTCGFIESAKKESIDEIFKAVEAKRRGLARKVIVCGCLSERYKTEIEALIPEADAFFGSYQWDDIVKMLLLSDTHAATPAAATALQKRAPSAQRADCASVATERYLTTPRHYAYLKIADGCNRKCSYCAIPLIKGRHRSVPLTRLVKEARGLAAQGVKELILIAQDTTFYGMDLYKKRMLGTLIQRLSHIRGIEWIRLHYSYPQAFPQEVLDIMACNPKVCKYLDIPLQHSSTKVLEKMRRGINHEKTQQILDKIRSKVPGVAIRTTLIVGHPGEGAAEFKELMAFVRHNRFEMMGAFTYSEEEGTYGALHYEDAVSEEVKQERYNALMELQAKIALQNNLKRVGQVEKVLVDEYKEGYFYARSQYESPEVDGQIVIPRGKGDNFEPEQFIGKFARVRIVEAGEYDLIGEFV